VAPLQNETFTIASRDSLLALAQSIDAAHILQAHGVKVHIKTLKTSGDLKLDAPLYDVAASAPKEGRAFFTRELDDALINGKADLAVHSFKDLPTEEVTGVSEPIFFSEENGADVLVRLPKDADRLVIGTSSLRRIHQLQHAIPEAQVVMLRGNVVTRLRKLHERDRGMNAILIASAGLRRIHKLSSLHPNTYNHLFERTVAEKIARELVEFTSFAPEKLSITELDELLFPTAPGQGVLALQMGSEFYERFGDSVRRVFASHRAIAQRVGVERGIMKALGSGCHAPLGVSALERGDKLRVAVCYSRHTQTNPVVFQESVFFQRDYTKSLHPFVVEARTGFPRIFWWGLRDIPEGLPPAAAGEHIWVRAIDQQPLNPDWPEHDSYEAIFVSSPAVLPYLEKFPMKKSQSLWAAGPETAQRLRENYPEATVHCEKNNGFAAAWQSIRESTNGRILWLGSAGGETRARATAKDDSAIDFIATYKNTPVHRDQILKSYAELQAAMNPDACLHLVTSKAAALAFAAYAQTMVARVWHISCFGSSAAEYLESEGLTAYHQSEAISFEDYIREISGDVTQMRNTIQGLL
jgi:hydroxymethylbilane synthase